MPPERRMKPFALAHVKLKDNFWKPRIGKNRRVTLPHEYKMCKETGRIDSLKLRWKPGDDNEPHVFWDSDIAKWIEAAGYSLTTNPDRKLEKLVDEVIEMIEAAQQPDGYFNVHFTIVEPDKRWTNLRDKHELYCAGHMMEAAVAYYNATGKRSLLDVMCRYADHINKTFGRGKRTGYPGHEEIELALVKLYHATGEEKYLKLSKYFLDERGTQPHLYDREAKARGDDPKRYWPQSYEYCQAHAPVREQDEAVGHSVRAMYLYSGMADVAAETGDDELFAACRKLWDSTTIRKMYITGGVGSAHCGERFTKDYDLPNRSAYAETCAAIGLVFFAHRMTQIEAHSRYADVMERALYNGFLSGVSLSGKKFFYENPLESDGTHVRQEWFGCACCPPNVARLLASFGSYIYSAGTNAAWVHLYVAGSGKAEIAGETVRLSQETDYPWDGDVSINVALKRPAEFALMLRIPGWCRKYKMKVNGKAVRPTVTKGYAKVRRQWSDGDTVELSFDMPVERMVAHPQVASDADRVAICRGPLVYCIEQCDHRSDVRSIHLPDKAKLTAKFDRKLFNGTVVIRGEGIAPSKRGWNRKLYRPVGETKTRKAKIKAIPYCLWDNRKSGAMNVWLPRA